MIFTASQDNRMFVSPDYRVEGKSIIIIDDVARKAALGHKDLYDSTFIQRFAERLSESVVVKHVILADFDFTLEWISDLALIEECVFLVDIFAGADKQPRGVKVIQTLRDKACEDQIIIFSKAEMSERSELFGAEYNYTLIWKSLPPDEIPGWGIDDLWPIVLNNAVATVERKCESPYLQPATTWNEINRELQNWRGGGPLFPNLSNRHGVKWWMDHGLDKDVSMDLQRGRELFAKMLSSTTELSHLAIFCGLKAIWSNRASARLLCEVAGISTEALDRFAIDRQLLLPANAGVDPQALAGLGVLLRNSEEIAWTCEIDSVTPVELIISGSARCSSAEDAAISAATLSKTPSERMKEPGRKERPGEAVMAAHKIRARAKSLDFSSAGEELHIHASFALHGQLALT